MVLSSWAASCRLAAAAMVRLTGSALGVSTACLLLLHPVTFAIAKSMIPNKIKSLFKVIPLLTNLEKISQY
jgi:hypothetical protein